ncbi:MAG: helix-turn-helix transcriptional regulator [Ruminococcaceae bacterium]|nr:helix-turn-helix transcriptional regulator [Oscillospiraceae bacterium]
MSYYDFGEILKSLRKQSGLTQSELGRRVGLSKAVVSKYETGIGYPNFETLIRIAKYFGVTTDYLLGEESGKTVDVSELTESQAELIHRTVAEFVKANKKSHQ